MTTTPRPFTLERFFARWEFAAPHMLSASDCEPMTIGELLAEAGLGPDALGDVSLGYTDSEGSPWLRERIAGFYPGLAPDDVLVTNAPEEAIFITMTALVAPGDRVVVQTPCYQALAEVARWRGAEVVPWPLVETETGWRADLDHLESLLTKSTTQLCIVNWPHNPTGWLPTRDEQAAIVLLARTNGARLFADEMYRGLEHDPGDALPPVASLDERAVSLWGMSKSYGLGGLRIGWLALRDRSLHAALSAMKDYTTICASAPSERLAHIALGLHDPITRRHVAQIRANAALAEAFAARTGLLSWRASRAGSVVFPRWNPGHATRLAERAAHEAGVVVIGSGLFDMGEDHIRLGLGRASFPTALQALETALPRLL